MKDRKSQIKLFTYKQVIWFGIALVFGNILSLYHDYKLKGYLDKTDLTSLIIIDVVLIAMIAALRYWANRPERRE